MLRSRLALLAAGLAAALVGLVGLAGCGGSSSDTASATAETAAAAEAGAVTLVSPEQAEEAIAGGGVQVIDVRTPEEYAEGHLDGATLIDFYAPDFAEEIGRLDPRRSYVVYCRSGNRSGQATALMAAQGFTDVLDVDGGIVAWQAADLPVTTG